MRRSLVDLACCAVSLCLGIGAGMPRAASGALVIARQHPAWDRRALWTEGIGRESRGTVDGDGDGLSDDAELALAKAYFPYYSVDAGDECSRHGIVFRVAPHPRDESKLVLRYVALYERDCGRYGFGSHLGDDESFSALVDPRIPPPAGILALRAISHQHTVFERRTACGRLPGCPRRCNEASIQGAAYPVVFSSANKHGHYVNELACDTWPNDLASCSLGPSPDEPFFVNAGEPRRPLTRDLTRQGFITEENGWTEPALMRFDPWSRLKFGGASIVSEDLVDAEFLIDPSGC